MSLRKVTVNLAQGDYRLGGSKYRIDKVTNSTDLRVGQWVDKVAVDNFIRNGYTVVISADKKR